MINGLIGHRTALRELRSIIAYEEANYNFHVAEHLRNEYLAPIRRKRGLRGHQRPRSVGGVRPYRR